jgi:hypothetical protein
MNATRRLSQIFTGPVFETSRLKIGVGSFGNIYQPIVLFVIKWNMIVGFGEESLQCFKTQDLRSKADFCTNSGIEEANTNAINENIFSEEVANTVETNESESAVPE